MVIFIEFSPPFSKFKINRIGAFRRVMFAWFALAYMPGELNDYFRAVHNYERDRLIANDGGEEDVKA